MILNILNKLYFSGISMAFCALLVACGLDREAPASNFSSSKTNIELPLNTTSDDSSLQIVERLPAPANTRGGTDSLLLVGDLLEVDVFQVDELDKEVQIDSSGRISMPLIGQLQAAGKTVAVLESELEKTYGIKHLQSPDITVRVKESQGQQVTLNGEFLSPGVYPTSASSTLLQAVALARGLSPIGDTDKIFIYRDFQGKKLVANYNLKQIQEGKSADPRIYGGDIVVAFSSKTKVAVRNLKESLGVAANAVRAVPLL